MATTLSSRIDRLSRERQALWAAGEGGRAARVSRDLEDLYAQRRAARAREQHGSKTDVVRRAKAEAELEKLIEQYD